VVEAAAKGIVGSGDVAARENPLEGEVALQLIRMVRVHELGAPTCMES
jgi:hypothetical protein